MHRPDPSNKPAEPLYSLVRLSATPTNHDWYHTNLPLEEGEELPQWAQRIQRAVSREVTRVEALAGVDSESDTDSEFEEPEVDMTMVADEDNAPKVFPHRYRIWGLAASPGGGCSAALVSKHVTQHSDRRPRSRLLFAWPADADYAGGLGHILAPGPLTTEGTVWEAMHGRIREMPAFMSRTLDRSLVQETPLRRLFKPAVPRQKCVFCEMGLVTLGTESICENGHSFGMPTSPLPTSLPSRLA